jgi:hypothetical protein
LPSRASRFQQDPDEKASRGLFAFAQLHQPQVVDGTHGGEPCSGTCVRVSGLEFELLARFAGDPIRVFSKHELARCIWRRLQISEPHRRQPRHPPAIAPTDAGACHVLVNKWGQGWSLTTLQ